MALDPLPVGHNVCHCHVQQRVSSYPARERRAHVSLLQEKLQNHQEGAQGLELSQVLGREFDCRVPIGHSHADVALEARLKQSALDYWHPLRLDYLRANLCSGRTSDDAGVAEVMHHLVEKLADLAPVLFRVALGSIGQIFHRAVQDDQVHIPAQQVQVIRARPE